MEERHREQRKQVTLRNEKKNKRSRVPPQIAKGGAA
jgi:hypothetical protein